MGMRGDMATLEGEGGREGGSIWTDAWLSRASLSVGRGVTVLKE